MTDLAVPKAAPPAPKRFSAVMDRLREKRKASAPAQIERTARDPRGSPLAFAQERLWFMEQLQPGTAVYNIATTVALSGRLDLPALAHAFAAVVSRHEPVRTTFTMADERPVQVIGPAAPPRLPLVDLAGLPGTPGAPRAEAELDRLAKAESSLPFDLERGPLLRTALVRLSPEHHRLFLTMHHLVSDGWSMGILLQEVIALYQGAVSGVSGIPVVLPELPIQYADFALWQRGWLRDDVLAEQLAYWRGRLAGSPALSQLPPDHPRPAAQTYRGARCYQRLPRSLALALDRLARQQGTTLFVILLGALAVLLHRWSGQDDLVIGTPIANRRRTEIQRLIGLFVNMLAVRADLAARPPFRDLARRLHDDLLEAHVHQELPFERLVEELHPERTASHAPLFQVVFAYQNVPMPLLELPGLSLAPIPIDPGTAMFDLTLNLEERPDGLTGWWEYSSDLFDPPTIARLAAHFANLLAGIAAADTTPIGSLPLLTSGERHQVTAEWNDTGADAAAPLALHHLFAAQVARTPGAPAVSFAGESLTYAGLDQRANRLAHHLRALGVGPESLVGICAERSLEMVVGLLAILKAGGAYVPLDPDLPRERLGVVLEDARIAILLTQERLLPRLPESGATVLLLDTPKPGDATVPVAPSPVEASGDGLAYVIFTSGSTGRPKGAMNTHRAVVNRLLWMQSAYRLSASDAILQKTPFGFDVSVWELFWPLATGARLVMALPGGHQDPDYLAATIASEGITTLHFVPSMLHAFLEARALPGCRTLRRVIASGEALSSELAAGFFARLPWVELHNLYGPTEAAIDVTSWGCRAADGGRAVPIGRPIANLRIHLLDRDLVPVPLGAAGELYIGGTGLARGYVHRPGLTAERFLPEPIAPAAAEPGARMYRTGDLARFRADGAIEYLGRVDHQVKIRGFRIELGEIETVLGAHPGVREMVVVAGEEPGGTRLVAYAVAREGTAGAGVTAAALAEHLAASLPPYMVPSAFVLLPALPLNPNGKVDRRALPAPAAAEERTAFTAPRNPVEEVLCEIWADVLELPRVGIHDNFFALGGHSLLAPRTVARLRQAFGIDLPLRALFDRPTVAGMAEVVEERRGEGTEAEPPIVPAARRDALQPLSFAQLRFWVRLSEGGTGASNTPFGVRFSGPLAPAALAASLSEIVRRHEVLRTAFVEVGGEPFQVVREDCRLTLPILDLGALPEGRREGEVRRLGDREGSHPFDLAREPLLRPTLVRLAPEEHVLFLVKHHLVTDGWSEGVLAHELAVLYEACLAGKPSPLPELPIQYGDFAVWERERLSGRAFDELSAYWQERLSGLSVLAIPTDRPRPATRSVRAGQRRRRRLDAALCRRIHELGRHENASLFMTLLAAWQALLAVWTGQDDVALTTNIAHRSRPEIERMIGLFTNALVLRTDLSGDPTFHELLGRVRETTLEAFAHQDMPFIEILRRMGGGRGRGYNEVFPVGFVLQNVPLRPLSFPDLAVQRVELSTGASPRDLILMISEVGAELDVMFLYREDIFAAATIEGLLGCFEALLQAIVDDPARRLASFAGILERTQP
jgi:amino acid adenylation domain-containing protein